MVVLPIVPVVTGSQRGSVDTGIAEQRKLNKARNSLVCDFVIGSDGRIRSKSKDSDEDAVQPASSAAASEPSLAPAAPVMEPQAQLSTTGKSVQALEDDVQRLQVRLSKSEELIKQLKHVIKAQHTKIEDLRNELDPDVAGSRMLGDLTQAVQKHIEGNALKDLDKTKEANEELNRTNRRLKIELEKARADNETLRKAGRRMKGLLQTQMDLSHALQLHDPSMQTLLHAPISQAAQNPKQMITSGDEPHCVGRIHPPALEDIIPADPNGLKDQHALDLEGGLTSRPQKSPTNFNTNASANEERGSVAMHGPVAAPRGQGAGMKLSRMSAIVPAFWKDQTGPRGVLLSLLDKAAKLLSDGPATPVLTLYLLDPWLRSSASEKNEQATLFYLQGKVTLQVLKSDKGKAEVPRFADLHSLPMRTKTGLAIAVQTPSTHRKLAVLQAVMSEKENSLTTSGSRGHLLGGHNESLSPQPRKVEDSGGGFNDTHLLCLQLACNVVGGVLEHHEQLGLVMRSQARVRECVEIASNVNKAKSLSDFEHRVKLALGQYFRVNMVRVLFYDHEARQLIVSAAQSQNKQKASSSARRSRKQGCTVFGLDKGVVGICAKKQTTKPMHVERILQNPHIDMFADGLDLMGRPPGAETSMLCGAMVFDHDDGPRLMGVLQLVERTRDKGEGTTPRTDPYAPTGKFSPEEESLFETLLQICAISAWRTFQIQLVAAKEAGSPPGLAHMLAG